MVLNKSFRRNDVIAFHIWKSSKRARGVQKFGLTILDADSPLNRLLLVKLIEERFDIKKYTYLKRMYNSNGS
jgi:hypothetical protein